MPVAEKQVRLEEAFERIEETILPCIAMMLETLIDASESVAENERRFLAAELKTLAAELEELTKAVLESAGQGDGVGAVLAATSLGALSVRRRCMRH